MNTNEFSNLRKVENLNAPTMSVMSGCGSGSGCGCGCGSGDYGVKLESGSFRLTGPIFVDLGPAGKKRIVDISVSAERGGGSLIIDRAGQSYTLNLESGYATCSFVIDDYYLTAFHPSFVNGALEVSYTTYFHKDADQNGSGCGEYNPGSGSY